nr:hypothetical protein [Tanacetum cinerariifolium]
DREGGAAEGSSDDAPIKGRNLDKGEAAAERASDDIEEMATVLTSMDAATVLASRAAEVPTGSGSIPTVGPPTTKVPTGNDVVPTISPFFATVTVVTPYRRRKGKEVMGYAFEEVEAKFNSVWKQIEDFIPTGSKEEAERIKRKGLSLEQESLKKQKTSEEVIEEAKSPDEVPEEKVHTEGQRSYWKITRLGGSSTSYKFFIDLLKHLDREDLNQLWRLVKETLSNRPPTSDKEIELWVELSRVHHVTSKDKEIFMLAEKDYPLRKGLALMMICYKLQVENYSQMANDLILKIYKIANSPRQQVIEFPLAEELPTLSKESCHCQKKSKATAVKIALLSKVKKKLSVKVK